MVKTNVTRVRGHSHTVSFRHQNRLCTRSNKRFKLAQTGALLQLTALITVLPTEIAFLAPSVLPALEVSCDVRLVRSAVTSV